MVEKAASYITDRIIAEKLISDDLRDWYIYSYLRIIETFISIGTVLTLSLFIGNTMPTVLFLLFFIVLRTWNYILFNHIQNLAFSGIDFINGTIRSVNPCGALHEDFEVEEELRKSKKENLLVYREIDDSVQFSLVKEEETVKWIFGSIINQSMSIDEGDSLNNNKSVLRLEFDKEQPLKTFYDYYGYVTTMLSFLVFRKDVFFEKISLLRNTPSHGFVEIAECQVRQPDSRIAIQKKMGQTSTSIRSSMNVIPVKYLPNEAFRNIVDCIVGEDCKCIDLPMNIIPVDNEDANIVTIDKVRNICSAMEMELEAAKIKINKESELEELINSVKKVIKEYRDDLNHTIPSKTYDNIFNSISHWGDSLADRTIEAWHMYEDELDPLISMIMMDVLDSNIAAFVKTRNNITHRGFREIDEKTANMAFVLTGLVYIMALMRLGLSRDMIKDLMARRFIG